MEGRSVFPVTCVPREWTVGRGCVGVVTAAWPLITWDVWEPQKNSSARGVRKNRINVFKEHVSILVVFGSTSRDLLRKTWTIVICHLTPLSISLNRKSLIIVIFEFIRFSLLMFSAYGYTYQEIHCSVYHECTCREGFKPDGVACRKCKLTSASWQLQSLLICCCSFNTADPNDYVIKCFVLVPGRLNEIGCTRAYHCEGGAICVDSRCVCPSGYRPVAGNTKCAKWGGM